jgi:hypothetical protein
MKRLTLLFVLMFPFWLRAQAPPAPCPAAYTSVLPGHTVRDSVNNFHVAVCYDNLTGLFSPTADFIITSVMDTLGNGTTVLDGTTMPGATFTAKFQAANASCAIPTCNGIDLRGFPGNNILTASVTTPAYVDVILPGEMTRASGVQIILGNGGHLHGTTNEGGTAIESANITTDYTPIVIPAMGGEKAEIDHIYFGPTTPSGAGMEVASVSAPAACPVHVASTCVVITYASSQLSSGIVNTSGTAVTFVNGHLFLTGAGWNTRTINITGVDYTVSSVTDSHHLVLTGTAGIQAGVLYSISAPASNATASGAASAYAGLNFQFFGDQNAGNDGYFIADASNTSTLTLINPVGVAVISYSGAANLPTPTVNIAGAFAIWGQWGVANIHDNQFASDLGIGCSVACYYNHFSNNHILSGHGAMYLGPGTITASIDGSNLLETSDGGSVSFNAATGYGLWCNSCSYVAASGALLNTEYAKFPITVTGNRNQFGVLYPENPFAAQPGANNILGTPLITAGSSYNSFKGAYPVNDQSGNQTNEYGSPAGVRDVNRNLIGSVQISGLNPPYNSAGCVVSTNPTTGVTPYVYGLVAVDNNGRRLGPPYGRTVPLGCPSVNNAATLNNTSYNTIAVLPAVGSTNGEGWACVDILISIGGVWKSLANCWNSASYGNYIDNGSVTPQVYNATPTDSTKEVQVDGLIKGGIIHAIAFPFGTPSGAALTAGVLGYLTIPFSCSITGWSIQVDAGTATVKFLKVAAGTAIPTIGANSINTSGVAIAANTVIQSTTLSDFTTTTVTAGDILAADLITTAGVGYIAPQLVCK